MKQLQAKQKQISEELGLAGSPTGQLLGMIGELGELSSVYGKRNGHIKTKPKDADRLFDEEMKDALADILVFMMNFANYYDIDLETEVCKVHEILYKRHKEGKLV